MLLLISVNTSIRHWQLIHLSEVGNPQESGILLQHNPIGNFNQSSNLIVIFLATITYILSTHIYPCILGTYGHIFVAEFCGLNKFPLLGRGSDLHIQASVKPQLLRT